ncbi:hypothetical protein Misp01_31650 [Microtetraspora sp. NBRC 13810]|nr:hypothetical protein Misp01_31650 [Microtetraspora sp. NBRC 13810]
MRTGLEAAPVVVPVAHPVSRPRSRSPATLPRRPVLRGRRTPLVERENVMVDPLRWVGSENA